MPVIHECAFKSPFFLPGGHVQTIAPRFFRKTPRCGYHREYLELEDGDFFSIDWLLAHPKGNRLSARAAILSHGLEGDSSSVYIQSLAAFLASSGWDVAARNLRSCGEMNRLPRTYHSGETDDLHVAVRHCLKRGYSHIALAGFSMGGNQTLMYLGRDRERVPRQVSAAAAVSVPCDLASCSNALTRPENRLYMEYFMRTLRKKMRHKHREFPELFDISGLDSMKTFKEFDDRFTAPIFGFRNAEDYWEKASSRPFLPAVRVPSLMINAQNDPFLGPECFPTREAEAHPALTLLTPESGGHCGFLGAYGNRDWLNRTILAHFNANVPERAVA